MAVSSKLTRPQTQTHQSKFAKLLLFLSTASSAKQSSMAACQRRFAAEKKACAGRMGCFIRSCNKDGTFPSKQCHASSAYCHCEDDKGAAIANTAHKITDSPVDCDAKRAERKSHWKQSSYRVGSANFSRRKSGHAHDNSADSKNVAGAREPSVHGHFIFRFENGQGNQSFFLSMTKIQLKRVNRKLSRRTVDAPSTGHFREAFRRPWEKFGSARLSWKTKKANFVDSRNFLYEAANLKTPNMTDLEKDLQRLRLTRSMIDWRRRTWTPSAGRLSFFFSFFLRCRLTTLDLRFLLWK